MRIEYTYQNLNYVQEEKCPICGSDKFDYFSQVSSQPFFVNEVNGMRFLCASLSTYWKCEKCEVVFQSPHMKQEDLDKYYSSGLYLTTIGVTTNNIMEDEIKRSRRNIEFLINNNVKPKDVLDVGAAHGVLLDLMKEKLECEGEGYDLHGEFASGDSLSRTHELVSAIHILEHYVDPLAALKWYRTLTSKWLLLEVPKCRGKEETKGLRFPHLFVFPYPTLKKMLEDTGFRVLAMEVNPDTRILAEVV